MKFKRDKKLPYPQPWEYIKDNIEFDNINCFYVDIGANDGLTGSNTAYFDLVENWDGICIEPHPIAFESLKKNRPNSKNLNLCISDNEGIKEFCVIYEYAEMLSGMVENYSEEHLERIELEIKKYGGYKKIIELQTKSMQNIFKENSINKVDYLSIDTEGSEFEILSGIDFNEVEIKVISTENSSKKDIKNLLKKYNYWYIGQVCADEIYCKKMKDQNLKFSLKLILMKWELKLFQLKVLLKKTSKSF